MVRCADGDFSTCSALYDELAPRLFRFAARQLARAHARIQHMPAVFTAQFARRLGSCCQAYFTHARCPRRSRQRRR
jgi:hypothetical protein